ncbi:MAG: bifunctional phosphoribosylaminoimidazolecarboxamide formyltransferase/IMP cyclohydrolase [Candidatus Xenobia bacterium]
MVARALISVWDKSGLVPFARELAALGWELVASGGTAKALQEAGLKVLPVEQVTGNPEAFGGRMKTISFQLEGGILFDRSNPVHQQEAAKLGVVPIDMVVCNFYPFESTVEQQKTSQEVIEMIDVGGPTMARAAAKNFHFVTIVPHPEAYGTVLEELKANGAVSVETRRRLASQTFLLVSRYDQAVAAWMGRETGALRYGENPHQAGWFLPAPGLEPLRLGDLQHLWGKQLSFNNYLDLDAAILMLAHLGGDRPACVIVKHNNPCGAAWGDRVEEAFEKAWSGDTVAAFGGVVVTNREVSPLMAEAITQTGRFIEVLAAPSFDPAALKTLQVGKNRQLLTHSVLAKPPLPSGLDVRPVRGGTLVQDLDRRLLSEADLRSVTEKSPAPAQLDDLLLAWYVCKVTKSNAIALAHNGMLVGAGAGQQDRVRGCQLAVTKAGDRARGAVAASDGFFPFSDGPQVLIDAGITALIQPGGSIRDNDTIAVCNAAGIPMMFTGIRGFKH